MKKIVLGLALVAFVGATTVTYAVAKNEVAVEKKDDKKKKKKKGACCADKAGSGSAEAGKGCCTKGAEGKTCGDKKTTTSEE